MENETREHGFEIMMSGLFGRKRKVSWQYRVYKRGPEGLSFDETEARIAVAAMAADLKAKPGTQWAIVVEESLVSTFRGIESRTLSIAIGKPREVLLRGEIK